MNGFIFDNRMQLEQQNSFKMTFDIKTSKLQSQKYSHKYVFLF